MKKVFALVLVSTLLLIPFAVFADDAGVVSARLEIDNVFNLLIAQDWPQLDIDQPWIQAFFATDPVVGDMPIEWGHGTTEVWNIQVTVQALSDYKVWSGYSSDSAGFQTLVGTESTFIGLDDRGAGTFDDYIAFVAALPGTLGSLTTPGPDTGDHGLNTAGVTGVFTDILWTGANNVASADVRTYDVLWNPLELTGNFDATDALDIDIYFLVTDPDV